MNGNIRIVQENSVATWYVNGAGQDVVYNKLTGGTKVGTTVESGAHFEALSEVRNRRNAKRLLEKAKREANYGGW